MDRVTDGGVEIDGGTEAEIKAELATETVDAKGHGTPTGAAAPKPADAVEDVDSDGDPVERPVGDAGKGKAAAGAKPGARRDRSFNGRIRELTTETYTERRARIAAEDENARLKTELEAVRSGRARAPESVAQPAKRPALAGEVGGVPLSAEKFPSYADQLRTNPELELEEYSDNRQDWRSAKSKALEAQDRSVSTASEAFSKTAETFFGRMAPVLKQNPKFYESIDPLLTETPAASALPPGHPSRHSFVPFVVEQIVSHCDHPDGVMVKLSADGSKELQRLRALSPEQVIREIAKMDLQIRPGDASGTGTSPAEIDAADDGEELDDEELDDAGGGRVQTSTQSAAEPPVRPVRGSSQQAVELEDGTDEDSDDAFFRKESRKALRKLNAR